MRTQTIKFSEFMSGEYKTKKSKLIKTKTVFKSIVKKVALSSTIPLIFTPHVFAETTQQAGATQYIGEKSLEVIAHALDPLVELMVALSFPIASVIMVGACFFFMFNNAEKAWDMIMRAGLGYVLIQLSPLFLKILKEVGNAI